MHLKTILLAATLTFGLAGCMTDRRHANNVVVTDSSGDAVKTDRQLSRNAKRQINELKSLMTPEERQAVNEPAGAARHGNEP